MKRPIKGRKCTVVPQIALLLVFIFLLYLFYKPSVRSYQVKNPAPFNVIVTYFTENPSEKPVSAHRNNVLRYGWDDVETNETLPQEVKNAIEDIFLSSKCKDIYISMWDGELDYCAFTTSREKIQSGIAFLPTAEKEQKLLAAHMVRECLSISDNWVYYEVYTPLGEKDFPY